MKYEDKIFNLFNEYLNKNFNLNMLPPSFGKDSIFKTFMQKMILSSSPEFIYKNMGLTYISPDDESIMKMIDVCKNYDESKEFENGPRCDYIYNCPTDMSIEDNRKDFLKFIENLKEVV